jgi:hypothetical protein
MLVYIRGNKNSMLFELRCYWFTEAKNFLN